MSGHTTPAPLNVAHSALADSLHDMPLAPTERRALFFRLIRRDPIAMRIARNVAKQVRRDRRNATRDVRRAQA